MGFHHASKSISCREDGHCTYPADISHPSRGMEAALGQIYDLIEQHYKSGHGYPPSAERQMTLDKEPAELFIGEMPRPSVHTLLIGIQNIHKLMGPYVYMNNYYRLACGCL